MPNRMHDASPAQQRLRGFIIHMAVYFVAMIVGVVANFLLAPNNLWFPLPMVIWGAPLALHAAYAMGLIKPYERRNHSNGIEEK